MMCFGEIDTCVLGSKIILQFGVKTYRTSYGGDLASTGCLKGLGAWRGSSVTS